MITGRRYS